jgi:hypothetical protein
MARAEGLGRAAASWLSAALLWGLGLIVAVAGGLRKSLHSARRGAALTWYSVRRTLLGWRASHSLEAPLWALAAVVIGVGIGLVITLR